MQPETSLPIRHSIREQIMQNLQIILEGAPPSAHGVVWSVVSRKPLTPSVLDRAPYACAIFDTAERVQEGAGWELRVMTVLIEFHVRLMEGDEPAMFLHHCHGDIVSRVGRDISLGGLALNTRETGSELDIEGAFNEYVSGVVAFDVSYRCRPNDPYTRV